MHPNPEGHQQHEEDGGADENKRPLENEQETEKSQEAKQRNLGRHTSI